MTARPSYGSRRPYVVPATLSDLQGPAAGVVELPATVAWSGRRAYDVQAPADLMVMYERVIVEAPSVEVLNSLIDQERLAATEPVTKARRGSPRAVARRPGM